MPSVVGRGMRNAARGFAAEVSWHDVAHLKGEGPKYKQGTVFGVDKKQLSALRKGMPGYKPGTPEHSAAFALAKFLQEKPHKSLTHTVNAAHMHLRETGILRPAAPNPYRQNPKPALFARSEIHGMFEHLISKGVIVPTEPATRRNIVHVGGKSPTKLLQRPTIRGRGRLHMVVKRGGMMEINSLKYVKHDAPLPEMQKKIARAIVRTLAQNSGLNMEQIADIVFPKFDGKTAMYPSKNPISGKTVMIRRPIVRSTLIEIARLLKDHNIIKWKRYGE